MKILFIFLLLVLSGCSSQPNVLKKNSLTVMPSNEIAVVSHGWHTGFVIPSAVIQQQLPQLKERFSNASFLEFGWGDRRFYQAKKATLGLTFQAAFFPTASVVRVAAVTHRASFFPNGDVRTLCLDDEHYTALIRFINKSFFKQNNGKLVALKKGLRGDSQFYKGEGRYHLMNNCNTWTAKGLKSTGLAISPAFKFSASSIIDYLDNRMDVNHSCESRVIDNENLR